MEKLFSFLRNLYRQKEIQLPASVILTALADRTRNITDILEYRKRFFKNHFQFSLKCSTLMAGVALLNEFLTTLTLI